ncbi:hypothetical protein JCM5350_003913 [Sporobolomyces pararoseus]
MAKAPRKSRAKPGSARRFTFHDKALVLSGGGYQCRSCHKIKETPKDARAHHSNQHTVHKGEDRSLCWDCSAALCFEGRSTTRHEGYCPRHRGNISNGWVWDEKKKQAFRIERKPGQNFEISLELCRDKMPKSGMEVPSIPPLASDSTLLPQTPISDLAGHRSPIEKAEYSTWLQYQVTESPAATRPLSPELSPRQVASLVAFIQPHESASKESENFQSREVAPASEPMPDKEYEDWFNSFVEVPNENHSSPKSSQSHSLAKHAYRLTPRQASRYPDILTRFASRASKQFW